MIPAAPESLVRHVVLDTTYTGGGANGWLDDAQYRWLENLLTANIDAPIDWRTGDIHDPATLAALSPELAANDPQQVGKGVESRPGGVLDRNTQLLVPAPFPIPVVLHGRASTPITAVARRLDQFDLFAIASDGRTMTNWWDAASGWAGWWRLGGGTSSPGGAGSPVTVAHRGGQHLDAFTVGTDSHVLSAFSDTPGTWSNWFQLGTLTCRPGSTVTVVARDADHLDLFTTASDGRTMSMYWSAGGGWARDWFGLSTGTASPGSTVNAVSRTSTTMDLFVVGADNIVRSAYWTAASGWSSWFALSVEAVPGGQVGVVSRQTDHVDIFTVGPHIESRGLLDTLRWTAASGWEINWTPVSGDH